jgi:hypothetical protein
MRAVIPAFVGIAIIVGVVLIIIDVARTPGRTSPPSDTQGTCPLVRRIVLPDVCICSLDGKDCGAMTTRPYAVFFTQAASCPGLGCTAIP